MTTLMPVKAAACPCCLARKLVLIAFLAASTGVPSFAQTPRQWEQHDPNRPQPPVVTPGTPSSQSQPGRPPADAIVLFDGGDLSGWQTEDGGPAPWMVANGYMEVVPGSGSIMTREGFGDVQLHVEWMTPSPATGEGQNRGNSGVFLMGRYEIQVLDSYESRTYPDGQAGAVYGQYPPLVNASRPPGQWQTYDIVFRGPHFAEDGELLQPAIVTVLHNGVLVQAHTELMGPTTHQRRAPYEAHADELPLMLQDHGEPVRYRNIWVRELEG